ncbi:MAG TPA: glycosyltransferase [Candidatus Binataceae bacterium]|nr:glycosyltransferase [Candidatus Binataceae bacterium]
MWLLVSLSLAASCIALGYYGATVLAGWKFARARKQLPPLPPSLPRVALLKPLHGANQSLSDNLNSFLDVDYPNKQYIFGVSDSRDPACAVLAQVVANHPGMEVRLEVGGLADAANDKVGKLVRMARQARQADILVLSDADIAVQPDYLRRVVAELSSDPRVGVVTSLYRAWPGTQALGAKLEAAYVNTDFLPLALLGSTVGPLSYAFGATIAIKREVLEAVGGFEALKDLLADDFHLGNRAFQCGYGIKLSSELVTIVTNESSLSDFWTHQLRWARTYRSVHRGSVATVLTHGTFWGLVLMATSRFNPMAIEAFGLLLAARYVTAGFMVKTVAQLPLRLRDLIFLPLKDLAGTAIFFASLLGRTVRWGDRRFRVLATGHLKEIQG